MNNEISKNYSFEALESKANLNPEQRAHLELLKDKMRKILGGKTKQELARAGDLDALNKYKIVLESILKFLKTKEMKFDKLEFTTADGKEVSIELSQELKYWTDFYEGQGVDWAGLPAEIQLTKENREELEKGAKALCPDGDFEKLKLLIIPKNIISTSDKFNKLHRLMCQGYEETAVENNFTESRMINLRAVKTGLRLILVKDVKNLANDKFYGTTFDIPFATLSGKKGLFDETGLGGLDLATYLIYQREFFKRNGAYLDNLSATFLAEKINKNEVYTVRWNAWERCLSLTELDVKLRALSLGCRLAKTIELDES